MSEITTDEYFMGRDSSFPPTDQMRKDAAETVRRANLLLAAFGQSRRVRSGYRPPEINAATRGASLYSKHMTCQAIDLEDNDGVLDAWCLEHPSVLAEIGLWQESPNSTSTWCHIQIVAPSSGHRVFIP